MAASVHPTINDQLTRVQLRLLRQRLQEERDQVDSSLKHGRYGEPTIDEKYNHLKEAASQRKELLDRLKHEQQLSRELLRPKSHPIEDQTKRHRPDRRTESQPQLTESKRTFDYPVRLQPLDHVPILPPPPPILPPQPTYALPSLPHQVIQPYHVTPTQVFSQHPAASNSRADMYEMMMMQNAQMHQLIMQQMMLNSVQPRISQTHQSGRNEGSQRERLLSLDVDDLRKLIKSLRDERQPPVYPEHRFNVPPYGMSSGLPAMHHGYHRPLEPIPIPSVVLPMQGTIQPLSHMIPPEHASHLQANYLRQQKEQDGIQS